MMTVNLNRAIQNLSSKLNKQNIILSYFDLFLFQIETNCKKVLFIYLITLRFMRKYNYDRNKSGADF